MKSSKQSWPKEGNFRRHGVGGEGGVELAQPIDVNTRTRPGTATDPSPALISSPYLHKVMG